MGSSSNINFLIDKFLFRIFIENLIFQHLGEESRRLLTRVWSSTEADTHPHPIISQCRVMIGVTVDSGACVTVMPSALCTGISIIENDLSRNGVEYEVANGESIVNLGERRCEVMTVGSMIPKRIISK